MLKIKNPKYKYAVLSGIAILAAVIILQWRTAGSDRDAARLFAEEKFGPVPGSSDDGSIPRYDYTEARDHIGEQATVSGRVLKVFTSKGGVTFLDFCKSSTSCPFSAVIFADDLDNFGDVSGLRRQISVTGIIRSYNNRAEMILNDPSQID